MKTPALFLAAIIGLAACGPQPNSSVVTPTATATPALTATPKLLPPTPTPIPTIALPTVTPSPTLNPDAALSEWMDDNGFEFLVEVSDGSKRYRRPEPNDDLVIDVYPDGLLAWKIVFDEQAEASMLYLATDIAVRSIEMRGLDADPVRDALMSPYQYPLTLQAPGYLFLLEKEDEQLYSMISARVTFFPVD